MKAKEVRNLDAAALQQQLVSWQAEYFAVREAIRTGKEKNHARLGYLRRDIARAQTLLKTSATKNLHSSAA